MTARIAFDGMTKALEEGANEKVDPRAVVPAALITWPSTITEIDEACAGFYGMVTLGAARGTGKTLLAIASSLEATKTHQVCYFAAEDDQDGLAVRFNNYVNAHKYLVPHLGDWHLFQTARGQTPAKLMAEIGDACDLDSPKPILVVMDSVNSLVEMSAYSYLDGLTEFGLWAMLSRRYSRGQACFLVVSETNKAGSVKGEKLPFWSDQVVIMQRSDSGADIVEIELAKSRRSGGTGELGRFIRIWNQGEFMSQSELSDLKRDAFKIVPIVPEEPVGTRAKEKPSEAMRIAELF